MTHDDTKPTAAKPRIAPFWMGPTPSACDHCGIALHDEFIDGATIHGPWAILHPACHRTVGRGLGVGHGQRYVKQADGRFQRASDDA
jgi:hypothetical protein